MTSSPNTPIYSALSESAMFRDYQDAFEKSTGLSLNLHQPGADQGCGAEAKPSGGTISPFCTLMAHTHRACDACVSLQKELESEAQLQPKTLKCFAGLCETAVPVRVGETLIAFLQTGRILIETPNQRQFGKIARELLRLGTEIDLKKAEEAYFASRVITPVQYQAMIKLLTIFATHLAACGSQLALERAGGKNAAVTRGRKIIDDGYRGQLSLGEVAERVNTSAGYFSEIFKKATGINFVEYVARHRVEKAKTLLHNPDFRISEIALDVGFQSLSQFNRTFRRFASVSPRAYRASHQGSAISAS